MTDIDFQSAQVLASFWDFPAHAREQPRVHWDDVWAVRTGLQHPALNNATLLEPLELQRAADLVARLDSFYAAEADFGYTLWDPWRTVDLTPMGYTAIVQPCMIREPQPITPSLPQEIKVIQVHDSKTLALFERALVEGVPLENVRVGSIWDERVLGTREYRLWVGLINERPVSTAMMHRAHGFVFVGFVSTVPDMRRRGFAQALTWHAVLSEPTLPAILHASDMGQPLYARMGFQVVAYATLWLKSSGVGKL